MSKKSRILVLMVILISVVTLSACSTGTKTETTDETGGVVEQAANDYFANIPEDIYKIDQAIFVDKVIAGEEMTILDIRSADSYATAHIKGAINIPWGPNFADSLTQIPNDKPVMIYCVTGQTAGQTVALLNMAGFDAKTVNLGWNLGISKVEGVDAVTETTPYELDAATTTEIDPEIVTAIEEYYAGLADVADTNYKNYKISEDNAKAALDAKDDTVIFLSIRSAEDYAKGHIEGAVNIPYGQGMETEFNTLPMDKTIIVYCYSGQTAGQTVAGLRLLGYDAVSLNAGAGVPVTETNGWINKGYPTVAS